MSWLPTTLMLSAEDWQESGRGRWDGAGLRDGMGLILREGGSEEKHRTLTH